MYFRLLALDVDGTLVNSKGELTSEVFNAIQRVNHNGSEIVIASGRNLLGARKIIEQLGLDLWYISSGGAQIGRYDGWEVLHQIPLVAADARRVIRLARSVQAGIFMEQVGELYWEGPRSFMNTLRSIIDIPLTISDDILPVVKNGPLKLTVMQENSVLRCLVEQINQHDHRLNLTFSMPHYLEVTRQGVNKGAALSKLAEYLGIPLSQVAAVGDGENDISMFSVAGLSVAMGNAPAIVAQSADWVAPTNDQNGAAWAITRLEAVDGPVA